MQLANLHENRRLFLSAVKREAQQSVAAVVDRLIEFSIAQPAMLELGSTEGLEQPSIGFDLKRQRVMLWKAYATDEKLEVLARSLRSLSTDEYAEFSELWRSIPGKSSSLRHAGQVPSISLKALESDAIWLPTVSCLEWGLRRESYLNQSP